MEAGLGGLIRLPNLPPYDVSKYSPDTWEYVLYTDALQRLVYITSYASFHSNQKQADIHLLLLAHRLTNELLHPVTLSTLQRLNLLSVQDYRAFGVIYGQYSRHLKEVGRESTKAAQRDANVRMRRAWKMYLDLKPEDVEIRRTYDSRMNPYTGDPAED